MQHFSPEYSVASGEFSSGKYTVTSSAEDISLFEERMVAMESPLFMIYAVSKKEILEGDTAHVRKAIDEKLSEFITLDQKSRYLPAEAKKEQTLNLINSAKRVRFSVSGYDEDSRQLWDCDEVQRWAWTWVNNQMHCMLFLDDESCLLLALLCLGGIETKKNKFVPNFTSPKSTEFESILESSHMRLGAKYMNSFLLGTFIFVRSTALKSQFEEMKAKAIKAQNGLGRKWWQCWK